jgi:hypothetical protein
MLVMQADKWSFAWYEYEENAGVAFVGVEKNCEDIRNSRMIMYEISSEELERMLEHLEEIDL